jgi:hypothetical protein
MSRATAHPRRFERFILGMGMSAMLFVMERRVLNKQRASRRTPGREAHRHE